jgi:hypothetical protein
MSDRLALAHATAARSKPTFIEIKRQMVAKLIPLTRKGPRIHSIRSGLWIWIMLLVFAVSAAHLRLVECRGDRRKCSGTL